MSKKNPYLLTTFFILACFISWAFMVPSITLAAKFDYALPTAATMGELLQTGFKDEKHIWLSILATLSSYGPLAAALILTAVEGKSSRLRWRRRVSRWQVGREGYRTFLILLAVIFIPLFAISLAIGPDPSAKATVIPLAVFLPYLFYELLTSGLEEPGWRGYALPRLHEKHTRKKSSIILGLVWGIWHWPAFIPVAFNLINESGAAISEAIITVFIQVLIYTFFNILAASFIHTWLFNRTNSAFINTLFHGSSNAVGGYIMAATPNATLGMVYGLVRWIVAIALIRLKWKENGDPNNQDKLQINP